MTLRREDTSEVRFNAGNDNSEATEATTSRVEITNGEYVVDGGVSPRRGFVNKHQTLASDASRAILPTQFNFALVQRRFLRPGRQNFSATDRLDFPAEQFNWHANISKAVTFGGSGSLFAGSSDLVTDIQSAVLTTTGGVRYGCVALGTTGNGSGGRVIVTDLDTGTRRFASAVSAVSSSQFRVVAATNGVGQRVFNVYYIENGSSNIRCLTVDVSTPVPTTADSLIGSAAGILTASPVNSFAVWAHPTSDRIVMAHADATNIVTRRVTGANTTIVGPVNTAHGGGAHTLAITEDTAGNLHVLDGRALAQLRVFRLSSAAHATLNTSTLGAFNPALTWPRLGIASGASNPSASVDSGVFICAEGTGATATDGVYWWLIKEDHTSLGVSGSLESATTGAIGDTGLLSQPFIEFGGTITEAAYCVLLTRRSLTITSGTDIGTHTFVARLAPATGSTFFELGAFPTGARFKHTGAEPIATVLSVGGDTRYATSQQSMHALPIITGLVVGNDFGETTFDWFIPALQIVESSGVLFNGTEFNGVLVKLENAVHDPLPRIMVQGSGMQGGALLRIFDGGEWGEASIVAPPSQPAMSATGVGTFNGIYTFTQVLICELADGRVLRSSPGAIVPVSATNNASFSISQVLDRVTMRSTQDTVGATWRLETYRTQANGSVFFRILTSFLAADKGNSISTSDSTADSTLAANKLLYTALELASEPAPAASALCFHRNRVFGVDATDRRSGFFSKELAEGFVPEFSSLLRFRLDGGNDMVAMASMDDKLLIFTRDDVYALTGDGPNKQGTAGFYGQPEIVAKGVGATTPYGVVSMPMGVMFHSGSGMKLLGRDLSVTDISYGSMGAAAPAGISGFTGNLTGLFPPQQSCHMPDRCQVWFQCYDPTGGVQTEDNSNVIIFDYSRGKGRWLRHVYMNPAANFWRDMASVLPVVPASVVGVTVQPIPMMLTHVGAGAAGVGVTLQVDNSGGVSDDTSTYVPMAVVVRSWRPSSPTLTGEVRVRRIHILTSGSGDNVRVTVAKARNPRSFNVVESETYLFTSAQLNDTSYGHGEFKLRYQKVQALDITMTTETNAAAGVPVFHGIDVDYSPYTQRGGSRRGALGNPSA